MEKYLLKKSDLKEDMKDFPLEVAARMIIEQMKQGNDPNIEIFNRAPYTNRELGGFTWMPYDSFWGEIVYKKDFTEFFERYPERISGDEILIDCNNEDNREDNPSCDKDPKSDSFTSITDEMHELYLRKNKDYGESFTKSFEEYGLTMCCIRLEDKMLRLKQLSKNTAEVKDESIEDTLIDMANYAVMSLMEIRKRKDPSNG